MDPICLAAGYTRISFPQQMNIFVLVDGVRFTGSKLINTPLLLNLHAHVFKNAQDEFCRPQNNTKLLKSNRVMENPDTQQQFCFVIIHDKLVIPVSLRLN